MLMWAKAVPLKRFTIIIVLVMLGASLTDWLWPFGFRFKYWQHRSDSDAAQIVVEELRRRFPAGTPSVDVKAFLQDAGASCRDRFEYYRCEYWHIHRIDSIKTLLGMRSVGSSTEGSRVNWQVDIWYDAYDREQRLEVRRWRQHL